MCTSLPTGKISINELSKEGKANLKEPARSVADRTVSHVSNASMVCCIPPGGVILIIVPPELYFISLYFTLPYLAVSIAAFQRIYLIISACCQTKLTADITAYNI